MVRLLDPDNRQCHVVASASFDESIDDSCPDGNSFRNSLEFGDPFNHNSCVLAPLNVRSYVKSFAKWKRTDSGDLYLPPAGSIIPDLENNFYQVESDGFAYPLNSNINPVTNTRENSIVFIEEQIDPKTSLDSVKPYDYPVDAFPYPTNILIDLMGETLSNNKRKSDPFQMNYTNEF
jgi:hypothetical protein